MSFLKELKCIYWINWITKMKSLLLQTTNISWKTVSWTVLWVTLCLFLISNLKDLFNWLHFWFVSRTSFFSGLRVQAKSSRGRISNWICSLHMEVITLRLTQWCARSFSSCSVFLQGSVLWVIMYFFRINTWDP